MEGAPSDIRLLQLRAKHRVVAADLAAIVARADERRLATRALWVETTALLAELQRECARADEMHRAWSERQFRAA